MSTAADRVHDALMHAKALGLFRVSDPGISLFNACLEAGAPMRFTPGMRVLEIGCCEADWLHLAHQTWPDVEFVGIDTRAPDAVSGDGKVRRMKADVLQADLFPPESVDAIVSLSAIEHVGLGHYGDPIDPDGDTKALAHCYRWLKPGGWLYFDVPYDPTRYYLKGTKCRVYNDAAILTRLHMAVDLKFLDLFDAYAHANTAGMLIPKPFKPADPFYYVAMVWRKA